MRTLAAAAAGALAGAATWPSGPWWWAVWFAWAPLLAAAGRGGAAAALRDGWVWGVCAGAAAGYWVPHAASALTGGPPAFKAAAVAVLFAWHAVPSAAAAAAAAALGGRLARRTGLDPAAAAAAAAVPLFVLAEALVPLVFPLGAALAVTGRAEFAQLARLGGAPLASALVLCVNAALVVAARPGRRRPAAAAAAVLLVAGARAWGARRIDLTAREEAAARASGRVLRAALLQGAVPFERRNAPGRADENIAAYADLTARAAAGGAELVVWPANTYERELRFEEDDAARERPLAPGGGPLAPLLARDVPARVHALLPASASSPATDASPVPSRHWTAVLKAPDGSPLGVTNKSHPTPLAEDKPLASLFPRLQRATPGVRRLLPAPARALTAAGGARLGAYICYDGVLPGPARALVADGAEVLVNPASDQWTPDLDVEPRQHLRLASLRAVEEGRWLLRATPSGLTAAVDASGRVRAELPAGAPGVLPVEAPLLDGATPYQRWGDWPLAAAAALVAGLIAARRPARAGEASLGDVGLDAA